MAVKIFVSNARNDASYRCYTYKSRFPNMSGDLLFHLAKTILDALKYCCRYKFAQILGTYPMLTAVEIHRCKKMIAQRWRCGTTFLFIISLPRTFTGR